MIPAIADHYERKFLAAPAERQNRAIDRLIADLGAPKRPVDAYVLHTLETIHPKDECDYRMTTQRPDQFETF